MATEIKVPVLPESVSDATIATWHKKVGDAVARDENIVDLETDKVVLEVPSTVEGVIKELKFAEGDTVTSQQVLAVIEEGAAKAADAIEPGAAAVLIVYENRWAAPFISAVRRNGAAPRPGPARRKLCSPMWATATRTRRTGPCGG